MRTRIAVLASGGGTNLQAILDHFSRLGESRSGDVVAVVSDRRDAGALDRARAAGIDAVAHATGARPDGPVLDEALRACGAELIVLAGYLRLVPDETVATFGGRILNVHPSLLPAFGGHGMYGERVHAAVIASGAKVTGVTVHRVNEHYDQGEILAQWPVPLLRNDTPHTLAARVLEVEHALYPLVVEQIAAVQGTGASLAHPRAESRAPRSESRAFAFGHPTITFHSDNP